MAKDKKKNKKEKKARPPLSYSFADIRDLARSVIAINPHMRERSSDDLAKSIERTINRAFNDGSWFVATAGWFALFDRWEENTFVDLYLSAEMVSKKLRPAVREQSTAFNEVIRDPRWRGPQ